MLNYINKWHHWNGGVGSLGCFGYKGCTGKCIVQWGWKRKAPLHGTILTNVVLHAPTIEVVRWFGPCRGRLGWVVWAGVQVCLVEHGPICLRELILSPVPVKWRVIYTDAHSLLNVPSDSLWLPVNIGKTLRADRVSCRVATVVDRGWGPKMLLQCVPKSSTRFPYTFFLGSGYEEPHWQGVTIHTLITEVKQLWAWLVLGWVTIWDTLVVAKEVIDTCCVLLWLMSYEHTRGTQSAP